jgi:hypothetical protein
VIFRQTIFEYQRVSILYGSMSMGQIWIVAKQFGFCSFTEAKVLGAVGHCLRRTLWGVSNHKGGTWCHCFESLSDRFGPFGRC